MDPEAEEPVDMFGQVLRVGDRVGCVKGRRAYGPFTGTVDKINPPWVSVVKDQLPDQVFKHPSEQPIIQVRKARRTLPRRLVRVKAENTVRLLDEE